MNRLFLPLLTKKVKMSGFPFVFTFSLFAFHSQLPSLVHRVIILLIVTAGHVIHPFLVVQIPAHRLFYALFKLQARFPAQFFLQLRRVDGITHVVAQTVGHVGNQIHVFTLLAAQQTVHRVNHHLDDVNVLPLIETAYVIRLRRLAVMENHVDGPRMILHIQPVAHVFPLAIHRQRLAVTNVVDEQRNQLLRELIRPVVVRTVRHDGRHAVRVVKRPHKVVAARLAGRVGAVRVVLRILVEEILPVRQVMFRRRSRGSERRLDTLRMRHLQCPVHLVGRDMIETLALILLRQTFPVHLGRLQQRQRPHHVGACKGKRILDAAVHVTLRRQVNDAVHVIQLHQLLHLLVVADVRLYEHIVRLVLNVLQVRQVSRIRQLVQVDDTVLRILVHEQAHHVAANKSGTAGNQYVAFECSHNGKDLIQ